MSVKEAVYLTNDNVEGPFVPDFFDTVVHYSTVRGKLDPKRHVVFFGGGVDINPKLYGEPVGKYSQNPNTSRDLYETACFAECTLKGVASVGICRGAQLITALLGGRLWQHVDGHAGKDHKLSFWDKREPVMSTSLHHQMMDVSGLSPDMYKVLAISGKPLVHMALNGWNEEFVLSPNDELEIVWYPKAKALAIQGHPEYLPLNTPFVVECRKLFNDFIYSQM